MATLTAELPADVPAACHAVVDQLAAMLKTDGDPRPIGTLRTHVVADLLLRPWQAGRAVTAHLQIIASLTSLAGEATECGAVNGLPITAAHLRELLRRLDALGVQAPDGGSVTLALTDDDGSLRATTTLDRLRRIAVRGCPDHRQAFVRTRDRTCRFPTCGQRVGWADAHHVLPHAAGGATDCADLCCLCRSHHRLKTFAHGWRFTMDADGVLHVTTPSGITRTTRPPGMRPPPPPAPGPPPEATGPPPTDPDHEPPPF